jgi:predicted membrane-bound spermidine synthase
MKNRWYFAFFIVSGFCSLVYEVVWLRLAMAEFGVTSALVSIVLSMFMAGLGLGSWCAGALSRHLLRSRASTALRLYAVAELLIGASALLVPYELRWGHVLLLKMGSVAAWQSSIYYLVSGAWLALTIIPACTCMGTTFPLLIAAIRMRSDQNSETSFSYLYVANVLGALLGTTISAFFLIEMLGFRGTLLVTGGLNAAIATSALAVSFAPSLSRPPVGRLNENAKHKILYGLPDVDILWMLFTTGFVSMALEVIWIRQFTPYLGNMVYTFAAILGIYLVATFWGSRDYRSWVRSHRSHDNNWIWTLLAVCALFPLVAADPLLPSVSSAAGSGAPVARVILGIGPFCAIAGFLTPMLVDRWSLGDPVRAGSAYAVNVVGCILGPLVAGFLLLPWLSERWASLVLTLPLFGLAALAALRGQSDATTRQGIRLKALFLYAAAALSAFLIVAATHDYETRFPERVVRRDYTATVMATGTGFDKQLLVNGSGMTSLFPLTKVMAHLPLASLGRRPESGLVVCFGMGTTFRSMLTWGIPTTAVDLVPSVPAVFGYFHSDAAHVLASPLAHVVVDDGRRFLDGSTLQYDVVTVDPPPPPGAPGSSLLYSREFYSIVKKHLRSGGIFEAWYPVHMADPATSASVAKALQQSFPHVRAFRSIGDVGIHYMASMEPLSYNSGTVLAARMPILAAADLVEWGPAATPEEQFKQVLAGELPIEEIIGGAPKVPALEDDGPINEYYLLRTWFGYYR